MTTPERKGKGQDDMKMVKLICAVSIDDKGKASCRVSRRDAEIRFETEKNYLFHDQNNTLYEKRLNKSEVGVVTKGVWRNSDDRIHRQIYYLEHDEAKAKDLLRADMEKATADFEKTATALRQAWLNRNNKE